MLNPDNHLGLVCLYTQQFETYKIGKYTQQFEARDYKKKKIIKKKKYLHSFSL